MANSDSNVISIRPPKPEGRPCQYGCGRAESVRWGNSRGYRYWLRSATCAVGSNAYQQHGLRCVEVDSYLSFGCYLQGPICTGAGECIDHRHAPGHLTSPSGVRHSCGACRIGPACGKCNANMVREALEHELGVEWTVQRLKQFSITTGWTPLASDLIAQGGSLAAVHLLTTMTALPLAA